MERVRCAWATGVPPFYVAYHDEEWGVPVHDDVRHFEMLVLEGAQAGLSWAMILNKREGYRAAFHRFDPQRVATMTDEALTALLQNRAIVRNRLKVFSARRNAQVFSEIQREFGSFDRFVWRFVEGRPIVNRWRTMAEVPATSPQSDALSKELKRRGMSFVGSTIVYAHMQAVGMVNDHTVDCWRYEPCRALE